MVKKMTPEDRQKRKELLAKMRNDKAAKERVKKALDLTEKEFHLLEKMLAETYLANIDSYQAENAEEDRLLQKLAAQGLIGLESDESVPN